MLFKHCSYHPFTIIFLFQLISTIHQPFGFGSQIEMVFFILIQKTTVTFPPFLGLEQLVLKEVQIAAIAVQVVKAIIEAGQAGTGDRGPAHLLQVADHDAVAVVIARALAGSAGETGTG